MNVLLVGVGQLGGRHLQALLKYTGSMNIRVIDPSLEALKKCDDFIRETEVKNKKVVLVQDYSGLSGVFDFVVIATDSFIRFRVLEEIYKHCNIRYLLLEKILFQDVGNYYRAKQLFKEKGTICYVNCPRRIFKYYRELKNDCKDSKRVQISYIGGNWGLACNAIHMLDLFTFLTGSVITNIDCSGILNIVESKRNGYKELIGTLSGHSDDGGRILLQATESNGIPGILTIQSDNCVASVIEQGEITIHGIKNGSWKMEMKKIDVLYQSNMTHLVLGQLMDTGECLLTSYDESMDIHLPYIDTLTSFFRSHNIDGCPIT